MSVLEIKDLHVTVATDGEDKEILKGVTLTIRDGDIYVSTIPSNGVEP